jgi:hypothetical protein
MPDPPPFFNTNLPADLQHRLFSCRLEQGEVVTEISWGQLPPRVRSGIEFRVTEEEEGRKKIVEENQGSFYLTV